MKHIEVILGSLYLSWAIRIVLKARRQADRAGAAVLDRAEAAVPSTAKNVDLGHAEAAQLDEALRQGHVAEGGLNHDATRHAGSAALPNHERVAGGNYVAASAPLGKKWGVVQLQLQMLHLTKELRKTKIALAESMDDAKPTSRAGFFRSLDELIGEPPVGQSWQDQWCALRSISMRTKPAEGVDPSWSDSELLAYLAVHQGIVKFQAQFRQGSIDDLTKRGWTPGMAQTYGMLSCQGAHLARALRERDRSVAACLHGLYECMCARSKLQSAPSPMLYRHLTSSSGGHFSLSDVEPEWATVDKPDLTGFAGLCSSGITVADCDPTNFSVGGYCRRYAGKTGVTYICEDSDVVGFMSRPEDSNGAHTAVMTYNDQTGAFPPNTLFRLKEVRMPGTWEAPGGVFPQQRLLIVTATYLISAQRDKEQAHPHRGGKLCSVPQTLTFGKREAYIDGIEALISKPLLTMEQECTRHNTWMDWKGNTYSIAEEWAYVNGRASSKIGCTPGTRDANNDGKSVEDFLQMANDHIASRRAAGALTLLPESHAFLTRDELLSIRLYSGPAYQPINAFLRQASALHDGFRQQLAQHPDITFSATTRQLCQAIRKLAAITLPEEANGLLYRGVRGALPAGFWESTDRMGMLAVVDMAFMSTSKNKNTPIHYMGKGSNVLWQLHAQGETDDAFHRGADISMFSQFAGEDEILFPPMSMLQVLKSGPASEIAEELRPRSLSVAGTGPPQRRGSLSVAGTGRRRSISSTGDPVPESDRFQVEARVDVIREREYIVIDVLPSFL